MQQMNTINIHHVKIQKANTSLSYRKLKKLTKFFRILEFFLFLVLISRFHFQLPPSPPTLLKLSVDYFHHVSAMVLGPRFVFVLGNTIIVILLINSGKLNNQNTTSPNYTSKTKKNTKTEAFERGHKKQRKQLRQKTEVLADTIMTSILLPTSIEDVKVYKRSKSDKLISRRVPCEKRCSDLRRVNTSENLRGGRSGGCSKEEAEGRKGVHFPEDNMSSEEFRQTIEDFIARQQRLLREEEFSIVG